MALVSIASLAQRPVYKVEGGRRVKDSVVVDSLSSDSLQMVTDTTKLVVEDSARIAKHKKFADKQLRHRFNLTRDTMSAGALLGLSVVPGMGQIYNRQWWKVPVFYGLMGGFVTTGVVLGNQSSATRLKWQAAVNEGASSDVTDPLRRKMQSQSDISSVMYVLTGVTYLYSVADATFNYRGKMNHIRKATTLAALFPGAGFIYTRTYWRLPIYYGGFAALGAVVDYNNRNFVRYKTAYNLVADGDDNTKDEFNGRYSADLLKNVKDSYRRDRDFGIIALAAVYLLSVVDTYVIATLKNWDVTPNLDVRVEPVLFDEKLGQNQTVPSGAGVGLKVKF